MAHQSTGPEQDSYYSINQQKKSGARSHSRMEGSTRYLAKSLSPWTVELRPDTQTSDARVSSSRKKLPVHTRLRRVRMSHAASAMMSGVRDLPGQPRTIPSCMPLRHHRATQQVLHGGRRNGRPGVSWDTHATLATTHSRRCLGRGTPLSLSKQCMKLDQSLKHTLRCNITMCD